MLSGDNISAVVSMREPEETIMSEFEQYNFSWPERLPPGKQMIQGASATERATAALIDFEPARHAGKIAIGENALVVALTSTQNQKEGMRVAGRYSLQSVQVPESTQLVDFPFAIDEMVKHLADLEKENKSIPFADKLQSGQIPNRLNLVMIKIGEEERMVCISPITDLRTRDQKYLLYDFTPPQWGKPLSLSFKPLGVWDGRPGEIEIEGEKVPIGKQRLLAQFLKKLGH
jgi:hypothetical protein